jgi:hypothetical protein
MHARISEPVSVRRGRSRAAARLTMTVGVFLSLGLVVSAPAFAGAITDFAGTGVAGAPTPGRPPPPT